MKRCSVCFVAVAAMAGCAGQPSQPGAAPPQPVTSAAPAAGQPAKALAQPAAVASATDKATAAHQVAVDASNAAEVQAAGYKIVNKNGEQLYCRKDPITGSRVQFQTTCLTAQELFDLQHQTEKSMSLITDQQTPVQSALIRK
jgi:hypothetical protein